MWKYIYTAKQCTDLSDCYNSISLLKELIKADVKTNIKHCKRLASLHKRIDQLKAKGKN